MRTKAFTLIGVFLFLTGSGTAQADPVEIRVVGPQNQPVAAAQLVVAAFAAHQTWLRQTDASGRVSLEMASLQDKRLGSVVVYARGLGLARAELQKNKNVIHLHQPKVIQGMVRDAAGKPLEGVTVRLRDIVEPLGSKEEDNFIYSIPSELQKAFTTRTQADGRWSIAGVPAQKGVAVALDDPAYVYALAEAPIGLSQTVPIPDLIARSGASIAGRVVDEAGQPVAGIEVFTNVIDHPIIRRQSAVTGQDGAFQITGLASGNYDVQVEDPSKERVATTLKAVPAREGQTTQAASLLLTAGAVVQGTVTDKATGKPMSEVNISSLGPQGVSGLRTQTDATGNYQLRLVSGTSRLYFAGPYGYVRRNLDVSVIPMQRKPLNVTLSRGLTLSGTTVNTKGEPMGGVFLFIYATSRQVGPDPQGSPPIGVTSDARGHWQALGLAPGQVTIAPEAGWEIIGSPDARRFEVPAQGPVQVKVSKSQEPTGSALTFPRLQPQLSRHRPGIAP